LDEDIGDRFANAVKFALDGSRTPRVVEPSAATSELGRVPGVRPRRVRRVFLAAVGFAVTIATIAFGLQIWRSRIARKTSARGLRAAVALVHTAREPAFPNGVGPAVNEASQPSCSAAAPVLAPRRFCHERLANWHRGTARRRKFRFRAQDFGSGQLLWSRASGREAVLSISGSWAATPSS